MKFITIPEQYRPSKKFIISIAVLAGATALFFGIRFLAQHPWKKNPLASIKVGQLDNPADTDTDNDGLKDWEEALWGTDPKNPDTDANGIVDGRQVTSIRQSLSVQGVETEIPPEQLTETDKLARDIYTSLAIASQNSANGELSEADSAALQNKIMEYILRRVGNFEQYQLNNLNIVPDSDTSTAAYLNFVNSPNATFQNAQTELFNVLDELSNNVITPEVITSLGGQYLDFAKTMKNQAVPQKFAQAHLQLANSFLRIGYTLQGIAVVENDPLTAFVNSIAIQDAINAMANAFGALGDVFAQP